MINIYTMAPPPTIIKVNSKTYSIQILNGEMENMVNQIEAEKENIRRTRERLNSSLSNLSINYDALLLMYIQQTGEFPPS